MGQTGPPLSWWAMGLSEPTPFSVANKDWVFRRAFRQARISRMLRRILLGMIRLPLW